MKDVWEKRWIIYKFILLFFTIIAIDQTLRCRILIGPEEVLQTITISRVPPKMKKLDLFEKAEYIHDFCNSTNIKPTNQTNDIFYYLKSPKVGVKNLLLCLPARMGTKPVLETLNTAYQTICDKNKTGCHKTLSDSNTLKIMFTRHPLDRLIIGFRQHKQNSSSSISNHNRKLLFTRPRNQKQKKKKGKYEFEEYLRNQVIDKKTVLPLYKECDVCGETYDMVYDLDEGLQGLQDVGKAVGLNIDVRNNVKKPAVHARRKFYSELSLADTENIAKIFKLDFLLFGYNCNFYD